VAAVRQHVGLPFQVDYEEGNILNALARITHGLTPYPDPHAIPNILNPYGPVAYYLLAIPAKLFGVSFLWPRLVIVASVVAICVFVALTIARLTGSALTGVVFGAIYGTLPVVESWSAVLRVDFLALALSAAGVYVFCRGVTGVASLSLFASTALFVAALFVKYTYIAAPLACALWLVTRKQGRQAARFAASMAAMCVVALTIATAATRGAILTHLFLTHSDPFSWSVYLLRLTDVVARHRVLVALAAVSLIPDLFRRRISMPALWLAIATLTAVSAGKLGSNWNHFLEWPAALCLCAALGWEKMSRTRPRALALVMAVVITAWLCIFLRGERTLPFDPYATVEDCDRVYALVKQYPGDRVLSENVGALVLAGKTVWVSNPFVYSQLVMRGGWPDAGLERLVRKREFDLIVAQWNYPMYPNFMSGGAERFSSGVVKAIVENYRAVQMYQCTDARVIFEKK
jgi:4-amino-4-deoxy-L-arabinose transferase-like glycosyltransferase